MRRKKRRACFRIWVKKVLSEGQLQGQGEKEGERSEFEVGKVGRR